VQVESQFKSAWLQRLNVKYDKLQGLTFVHFSTQRVRLQWIWGCSYWFFEGVSRGI